MIAMGGRDSGVSGCKPSLLRALDRNVAFARLLQEEDAEAARLQGARPPAAGLQGQSGGSKEADPAKAAIGRRQGQGVSPIVSTTCTKKVVTQGTCSSRERKPPPWTVTLCAERECDIAPVWSISSFVVWRGCHLKFLLGNFKGKASARELGADGKFESPKLRASTRARVDEAAEYREMRDQVCRRRPTLPPPSTSP